MKTRRTGGTFCKWYFVISLCVISVFSVCASEVSADEAVTLRVALYPYVPDRIGLFHKIETVFEREHPGVNLELVEDSELLWYYYSGGLQKVEADIYEIDTILLSEMVGAEKIAPMELPYPDFAAEAIEAVTRNGKKYGVPHWLCGNFLFYRKGDSEIENARTWTELQSVFRISGAAMLVDLKGSSTLGEWYLTVLAGLRGLDAAEKAVMQSSAVDPEVVSRLSGILMNCPSGFCRSEDLHERTGYYARAFISGKARAYIGYSESLSYALQYAMDNCLSTSGCLTQNEINVRKLPGFTNNNHLSGIGWVDALAIDSRLSGRKRNLAKKLIEYIVSDRAYRSILTSEWGKAPRYLIPARRILIEDVPLYHQLYQAHEGRKTGTTLGLNSQLRKLGKQLDCALPIDRTDIKTREECASVN